MSRATQRKGDLAVATAVRTFTALGYDVALLLTESAPYDLIVDTGQGLKRVQVKFSNSKEVGLRNTHCNTKGVVVKKTLPNAYDWLFVLMGDGREYLIRECLSGRATVTPNASHLFGGLTER